MLNEIRRYGQLTSTSTLIYANFIEIQNIRFIVEFMLSSVTFDHHRLSKSSFSAFSAS